MGRKLQQDMRAKGAESSKRMLGMFMGSQGNLVMRTSFSGWSELAYQSKKLREVDRMRRDMRSKGDESAKRMLGMLMNSQAEVLLKAVFAGWREFAVQSSIARMKENLDHLKGKGQEGSKRMLSMLLGSQGHLMGKAAFTAWHELVSVLKQEKEIDQLRSGMKAKGAESSKRMLTMLLGAQEGALTKAAFAGWRDHVIEVNAENVLAQMQQDLRAKGAESSKRMLGMLMGSQAEVLKKAAFAGWWDLVIAERINKIREQNMKTRNKEDESRRR